MDSFGKKRAQLLQVYPQALEASSSKHKDRSVGQVSLFGDFGVGATSEIDYPDVPELTDAEKLKGEKDLLGFYVTGHPLAEVEREMRFLATKTAADIAELEGDESVKARMVGIVTQIRKRKTRNGEIMADVTLEDLTGEFQVIVFPKDLVTHQSHLYEGSILVVEGKAAIGRERAEMTLDSLKPLKAAWEENVRAVHVDLLSEGLGKELMTSLKNTFRRHRGKAKVLFHVKTPRHGEVVIQAGQDFVVTPSREFVYQVEDLLDKDRVSFDVAPYRPKEGGNGGDRPWQRAGA